MTAGTHHRRKDLRTRYYEAVLRGDRSAAALVIEDGLLHGWTAAELLLEVIAPAQVELGRRWQDGLLSVAHEHYGTQIAIEQMDRLRTQLRPKAPLGRSAVVTTIEGEHHFLGARVVADLLAAEGWDTVYLGANTPTADLVEFVRQRQPDVVALSVTMAESLPAVQEAVRALSSLDAPPKLLVGGSVFDRSSGVEWDAAPDWHGSQAVAAVAMARRLVGLTRSRRPLDVFLRDLGRRVQTLRKGLGWSQQQLADKAGLDRTYISAAEHGKQNLTLGAVMRLSDALDVPIEQLLCDEA